MSQAIGMAGWRGEERGEGREGGGVPHTIGIGNKQLVLLIKCAAGTIV